MRRVVTHFEEVRETGHICGKCIVCGKQITRQKTFMNTVNPYNRNPDGSVRTYRDVAIHVHSLVEKWKTEQKDKLIHERCKKG